MKSATGLLGWCVILVRQGKSLRGKLGKAAAMKVAYAGFVVPGLLERWPEAKKERSVFTVPHTAQRCLYLAGASRSRNVPETFIP